LFPRSLAIGSGLGGFTGAGALSASLFGGEVFVYGKSLFFVASTALTGAGLGGVFVGSCCILKFYY